MNVGDLKKMDLYNKRVAKNWTDPPDGRGKELAKNIRKRDLAKIKYMGAA